MSHFPSPVRYLAAASLAAGAVVLPGAAALAGDTYTDPAGNRSQVEYYERRAAQDETSRSRKARIEHEERMAQLGEQAASSSTAPDPAGLPIGAVVGLIGFGAAVAGGTVLIVRHQQARPRTT